MPSAGATTCYGKCTILYTQKNHYLCILFRKWVFFGQDLKNTQETKKKLSGKDNYKIKWYCRHYIQLEVSKLCILILAVDCDE